MEAVAAETVGIDVMKRLHPSLDGHPCYHLIGSVFPFALFKSIHAGKPDASICGDIVLYRGRDG